MAAARHIEPMSTHGPLTIRRAIPNDIRALADLAGRDTADPLEGEVLMAEVDGLPWAAIELTTGRVVADPFRPTAEMVELLRMRAKALTHPPRRGRGLRVLRSLLRPA